MMNVSIGRISELKNESSKYYQLSKYQIQCERTSFQNCPIAIDL